MVNLTDEERVFLAAISHNRKPGIVIDAQQAARESQELWAIVFPHISSPSDFVKVGLGLLHTLLPEQFTIAGSTIPSFTGTFALFERLSNINDDRLHAIERMPRLTQYEFAVLLIRSRKSWPITDKEVEEFIDEIGGWVKQRYGEVIIKTRKWDIDTAANQLEREGVMNLDHSITPLGEDIIKVLTTSSYFLSSFLKPWEAEAANHLLTLLDVQSPQDFFALSKEVIEAAKAKNKIIPTEIEIHTLLSSLQEKMLVKLTHTPRDAQVRDLTSIAITDAGRNFLSQGSAYDHSFIIKEEEQRLSDFLPARITFFSSMNRLKIEGPGGKEEFEGPRAHFSEVIDWLLSHLDELETTADITSGASRERVGEGLLMGIQPVGFKIISALPMSDDTLILWTRKNAAEAVMTVMKDVWQVGEAVSERQGNPRRRMRVRQRMKPRRKPRYLLVGRPWDDRIMYYDTMKGEPVMKGTMGFDEGPSKDESYERYLDKKLWGSSRKFLREDLKLLIRAARRGGRGRFKVNHSLLKKLLKKYGLTSLMKRVDEQQGQKNPCSSGKCPISPALYYRMVKWTCKQPITPQPNPIGLSLFGEEGRANPPKGEEGSEIAKVYYHCYSQPTSVGLCSWDAHKSERWVHDFAPGRRPIYKKGKIIGRVALLSSGINDAAVMDFSNRNPHGLKAVGVLECLVLKNKRVIQFPKGTMLMTNKEGDSLFIGKAG